MAHTDTVNRRILALSALSMGFSMISSAFGFYYVKIFLNIYHVDENWFQFAQTLFLVWNAINDPLFAYLQDTTNFRFSRTRRESVLYAAPFFAISFLVPWFPWADPATSQNWVTGVHLITALCLWDTMFTYVGLAFCCLFTEISRDSENRMKMVRYNQIGSLLGSSSIFILQYMSDQLENMGAFQTTSIVIAIVSFLLMRYCGKHAHTEMELDNEASLKAGKSEIKKSEDSYLTLLKQIFSNRDFLAFVVMNFMQEFHRTFLSNFFAIFADQLIVKGVLSPMIRSIFYGAQSTGPKLLVIFGTPIVSKFGYFNVIRYSQRLMMVLGLVYYVTGPINYTVLMAFMVLDSCITDGMFSLFNLSLSDIADKDMARYNRRHPVTSMVYGCNALVVKPAISLSPMLVVYVLNKYGYEKLNKKTLDPTETGTLNHVMFSFICLYPCIIAFLQHIVWSFYTIRDQKKDLNITLLVAADEV